MSDQAQGPGWWQASDGKWYPPPEPQRPTAPVTAGPALPLFGKGVTGRLTVDDHFVAIDRKGARAKMTHGFTSGVKRIPIDSITAVQFKVPGLANGYIQFTLGGGHEGTRGLIQATKDENTVMFAQGHHREFEAIRQHIEQRITQRYRQAHASPQQPAATRSIAEELRALAYLRDQRVLTEAEFEQQKARLLQ